MATQETHYPTEVKEGIISTGINQKENPLKLSKTYIEVLDALGEGEIEGLVTGEYLYSGNIGATGWASAVFYPYTGAPLSTGIRYLRSIYWNDVPVVNSQNQYNYQRIDVSFTPGLPDGSLLDQSNPELTISRTLGERLRGTTTDGLGTPTNSSSDFTKYYTIQNRECKGVIVNIRIGQFSETIVVGERYGDTVQTKVDYKIYYRPTFTTPGKNTFAYILGKEETIWGKTDYGFIKSSRVDFVASFDQSDSDIKDDAGFTGWEIKIIRTTPDSTTTSIRNQTYIDSITEIYSSAFTYPNTAIVRSKFEAEFFQQVPNRAFDCKLLKVKIPDNYDPITKNYQEGTVTYPNGWEGDFHATKQWTDNPAWCYYDLLTNKRYGLGKYIDEAGVDKWTLYEIGKYCDKMVADGYGGVEPLFTCNVLINSREEAYKVINDMASVFNAISYYGPNGQIYAVQDALKDDDFVAFTNANVENGDFNYSSSSKRNRHTVAIVRYNDKTQLYKPAIEYIEDIDGIRKHGYREREMTAFGCTSRGQATRLGRWALLSEALETETINFVAGLEGAYLRPGDLFKVFDTNRKTERHAGRTFRIDNNSASNTNVVLDSNLSGTFNTGTMYTFSLVTPGYYYDSSVTTDLTSKDYSGIRHSLIQKLNFTGIQATGYYDSKTQISFNESFNTTDYSVTGNLIWFLELASGVQSYGEHKTFLNPSYDTYRVLKVAEKDNFKYEVVGLQYSEQKYKEIESGLNYDRERIKYRITPAPPDNLALNIYAPTANTKIIYYSFSVNNYSGISSYRVYAKDKDYPNSNIPDNQYLISNLPVGITSESFLPSQTGDYYFRVYSYNDEASIYSSSAATGHIEVKGINPIRDVMISSLTFESVSGDNAAGNRLTGEYYNSSPVFKWKVGLAEDSFIPSDFKYRISIREPSPNNIPSTTVYYQNTGYTPENLTNIRYQFDIETNAAATNGPYRNYDIVVEAITPSGETSAGNNVGVGGTDVNWTNFPFGYDIFNVSNFRPTGFNLSTGVGHPARPPWEQYNTRQIITPNGDIHIRWSGNFPPDIVGAYVFSSTGMFSGTHDIVNNAAGKGIRTTHGDWDIRSKTLQARCGMIETQTGYIGVAFYDIFDDYFIKNNKWGTNIGSGLSGCYNVARVYSSGTFMTFGIGTPDGNHVFDYFREVTSKDGTMVDLVVDDGTSLLPIIETRPVDPGRGVGRGGTDLD